MTLITATVIKESMESKLGIAFTRKSEEAPLTVKLIREGGLFDNSGLEAGMVVDTINGVHMTWKTPKDAADELRSLGAGEVSVNAIAYTGSVHKELKTSKVGISLKNSTKAPGIFVSKINDDSAFADTELYQGLRVLSINGVPCPGTTKEAIKLVKEAVGELKIVCADMNISPDDSPKAVTEVERVEESAPVVEEKKEDAEPEDEDEPTPEEPKEGEEDKERSAETAEGDEKDKGILDSMFSACIC